MDETYETFRTLIENGVVDLHMVQEESIANSDYMLFSYLVRTFGIPHDHHDRIVGLCVALYRTKFLELLFDIHARQRNGDNVALDVDYIMYLAFRYENTDAIRLSIEHGGENWKSYTYRCDYVIADLVVPWKIQSLAINEAVPSSVQIILSNVIKHETIRANKTREILLREMSLPSVFVECIVEYAYIS